MVAPRACRAGLSASMGAAGSRSAAAGVSHTPARGTSPDGTVTQGGHISTEPRINERIRVPEVRLVGPAGEQVGIVAINDALALAQEADLDLVEVAPTARPPVCKLMDYGKFKYESALKARESRKNQTQTVVKEIKLRPKIDPHDYGTKKGHVERFLKQGDKVKVTIMFRGREQSRPELGHRLLQRLAGDVQELGFVEAQPKLDGRNMIMVIGPHKKKADQKVDRSPGRASARPGARESAAAQQSTVAHEAATAQESMATDEVAAAPVAPARRLRRLRLRLAPAPAAPATRSGSGSGGGPACSGGSGPAAPAPGPAPAPARPGLLRRLRFRRLRPGARCRLRVRPGRPRPRPPTAAGRARRAANRRPRLLTGQARVAGVADSDAPWASCGMAPRALGNTVPTARQTAPRAKARQERRRRRHAEDEDAHRRQQAIPADRHRQGNAPPGQQAALFRAQAEYQDAPAGE